MPKRQKSPEDLKRDLAKIYTDGEGQLPDFTRLDGKQGSGLKTMLLGLLAFFIVLAAVSWVGFFIFIKPSGFTGEHVTLKIDAADQLTSGGYTDLAVRYANGERTPLASASLSLTLPKEFIVSASDSPLDQNGQVQLGSIAAGADGTVHVRGWVRKEVGATLTFQAALNYKPADFNSQFQKIASLTVGVGDSALALSATTTDTMTPGDPIDVRYDYENLSDREIDGVRLAVDPLDGFVFSGADPAADVENVWRWTIPKLEPHAKGEIVVHGTFSTAARGPKSLHGRIGFADDDTMVTAAEADAVTDVQKSDLALTMIVNGSNQPPAVSLGDVLHFSIDYKNSGDVALHDVTVAAELPSSPAGAALVDWVSLKDDLNGARKDDALTWTKTQIPGLETLKPGDEGSIDFSVQLTRKPAASVPSGDFAVDARIRADIGRVGRTAGPREVVSDPLVIKLNSDAAFKAFGRYFDADGVPLGSGPLPPKVGQTTVYRINWVVQNTLHELSNLNISTVLPQGVKWTGVQRPVDAGDLTFDETGRKVEWRLNKMPTSVTSLTITFDVEVTPSFEDIGNVLPLTGDSRFEAFDKNTQTVILKTQPPIDTSLPADAQASAKGGAVQE